MRTLEGGVAARKREQQIVKSDSVVAGGGTRAGAAGVRSADNGEVEKGGELGNGRGCTGRR